MPLTRKTPLAAIATTCLAAAGLAAQSFPAAAGAQEGSCDRYASPSGSDSAAGTVTAPFRTAAKLAGSLDPGQTGCLRAGTYSISPELKLTTEAIGLRSYPGEEAKLVGRLWVSKGARGARIEDLVLDGRNPKALPSPTITATDVVFRGNDVFNGHTATCFSLGDRRAGRADRAGLTGNRVHDCGVPGSESGHGVAVLHAADVIVGDNWIYSNANRGVQLYPNADDNLISGNVIDANGEGLSFGGSSRYASERNRAEGNVISNSVDRWNVGSSWAGAVGAGNVLHANCLWTSRETFRGIPDGSGVKDPMTGFTASASVVGDPMFVDSTIGDYRLQPGSPCVADETAPETTITAGPSGTVATSSVSFEFSASEPDSGFACRFDDSAWEDCSSPKTYSSLSVGAHVFEVRATDAAGNVDPTPASRGFTVELAAPRDAGYPSLPQIDWDGDFDGGCQLVGSLQGAWDRDETNADYTGGSTTLERTIVGEGTCAARFTNAASTSMTRSELQRSESGPDPEFLYEVLAYVPSGQSFPKGSTLTQTKMPKVPWLGHGCYNGGVGIADGGADLHLRTVSECTTPQADGQRDWTLGPLPRDRWFAFKVHARYSDDPSVGFVEAWVDPDGPGPGEYTLALPKTYVDNESFAGATVRMRIGQYRQATDHTTTVYMDGFRLDCVSSC